MNNPARWVYNPRAGLVYWLLVVSNTNLLVFFPSRICTNINSGARMWHFAQILPKRQCTPIPAITILCLIGEDTDRSLIASLCQRHRWGVSFSGNRAEAERMLHELKPQIMLFDRDIAGCDWREFVAGFAGATVGVCIMLLSKVIDDNLWNDLVSNGGYELLRTPLREEEVSRAVRMARSYWSSSVKAK